MFLEEFQQLAASYGLTAQERYKDFWAVSYDGYHYTPIGNPVTLKMTLDEWHSMLSAIAGRAPQTKEQDPTAWMHPLLTDLRTENEQLRAIVKEVATGDTAYYDSNGFLKCIFCQDDPHTPSCIVTLAHALMQKWEVH